MKALLLLFPLLLFSCKNSNRNISIEYDYLEIQIKKEVPAIIPPSDLFTLVDIIKLETEDACLIGEINELKLDSNDIYIIESLGPVQRLLRFSKTGKFLNQIGEIGRGPEEIEFPRDFILTEKNLEIWSRYKICRFSKEGEYIDKVFDAHIPGTGFFKDEGFYFLYHSLSPPYFMTKRSRKGEILESYFSYDRFDAASAQDKVFKVEDEYKLFASAYDTVYSYKDDSFYPSVVFRYENNNSPFIALTRSKDIFGLLREMNSCVTNYLENSNIILLEYIYDKRYYYCIYEKQSHEINYYNKSAFVEIGIPLKTTMTLTEDNKLITYLYIHELKDFNFHNNFSLSQMEPSDNPVLLVYDISLQNNE